MTCFCGLSFFAKNILILSRFGVIYARLKVMLF